MQTKCNLCGKSVNGCTTCNSSESVQRAERRLEELKYNKGSLSSSTHGMPNCTSCKYGLGGECVNCVYDSPDEYDDHRTTTDYSGTRTRQQGYTYRRKIEGPHSREACDYRGEQKRDGFYLVRTCVCGWIKPGSPTDESHSNVDQGCNYRKFKNRSDGKFYLMLQCKCHKNANFI